MERENIMKKTVAFAIIAAIVLLLTLTTACDNTPELPDYPLYALDESGHHIADIDYDAYAAPQPANADSIDIRDFGASPDADSATNAAAINEAVSAAAKTRSTVLVDGGVYFTDTVFMQSGVTLYIAKDSALSVPEYSQLDTSAMDTALIKAVDADEWTITGGGMLCGRGTDYTRDAENTQPFRPMQNFALHEYVLEMRSRIRDRKSVGYNVIYAESCKNVTLSDFVIYESSTWTVNLNGCDNVTVNGLVIDNNVHVANSDGIDVSGSSNVFIQDCFIATGDDGIVLKSNTGAINNVTIKNCRIFSLANNFKIGTETGYDVSDVSVSDCYFFKADTAGGYSGIAIESADGANVARVEVKNIVMQGITSPLLIWLGCRLDKDNGSDGTVGSVSDITIDNIRATDVDMACAIVGCEYEGNVYPVENVRLSNMQIVYRECEETLDIYNGDSVLDANMNGYPEITRVSHQYLFSHETSLYYDLPCYGIYADKVEGLTIDNVSITQRMCNTRPESNFRY